MTGPGSNAAIQTLSVTQGDGRSAGALAMCFGPVQDKLDLFHYCHAVVTSNLIAAFLLSRVTARKNNPEICFWICEKNGVFLLNFPMYPIFCYLYPHEGFMKKPHYRCPWHCFRGSLMVEII
jgi:hypothetical protein